MTPTMLAFVICPFLAILSILSRGIAAITGSSAKVKSASLSEFSWMCSSSKFDETAARTSLNSYMSYTRFESSSIAPILRLPKFSTLSLRNFLN